MKDGIGQEIHEGDKVAWGSGVYAGFEVYTVERLTPKRLKLYKSLGGRICTSDPCNVIVVTEIIKQ